MAGPMESPRPTLPLGPFEISLRRPGKGGGPRTAATSGAPPPAADETARSASNDAASNVDEPKDILGRLREFREAVEAPRPSTPRGPEGGGRGSGGVTMPNLPSTGFGVGN